MRHHSQRHDQNQINKFNYGLGVRKEDRMVRVVVTVKSTSSHTAWKRERDRMVRCGQHQINKFTYSLDKRNG